MIEEDLPNINVGKLTNKIREEVKKCHNNSPAITLKPVVSQLSVINSRIGHIESLLRNAESRAVIRTKWPNKIGNSTFNIPIQIQNLALRVLSFLFKDQREVNLNLIGSAREAVEIDRQLLEKVSNLNTYVDEFLADTNKRFQAINQSLDAINERQKQILVKEEDRLLDAFYVAFEDKFRGSREDILNKLKVYLPLIKAAEIGTPDTPILDVGCGRGEWLELLYESGYVARGIDINRVMLSQCKARNLDVSESDVIAYLQSLPDDSLGGITGFHIIEHLPFTMLVKLFDETLRVLKPQGLVVFETPNPDNILVGSNTFYLDPTHRNPLPSSMIKFVAESRGICQVEIMNLHPYPQTFRLSNSELAERFNDYFYGAQDYALIGYKA